MKEKNATTCATCRRELDEGMDAFEICEGLMGNHGFVPITDALLFCCVECLRDYFKSSSGYMPKAPRRVP